MVKEKKSLKNKISSRRKFFKNAAKVGAVVAGGGILAACDPNANRGANKASQETVTLKMQAAWHQEQTYFMKWLETMQKWSMKCLEVL